MYEENAPIKYVQPQTLAAMSSSLAKRVHNQCRNYQFYITAQCCPPAIPYIILVYLQWMNCQGLVSSDLVRHYRLVLWRSTHLGLVGRSFYDFDPDATWNGQHGDKRCWPCCQRWRYCMAAWLHGTRWGTRVCRRLRKMLKNKHSNPHPKRRLFNTKQDLNMQYWFAHNVAIPTG